MENRKAPYRMDWIGTDDLRLFLLAFKERDSTVKGADSIHELAHYEFTAFAFINR